MDEAVSGRSTAMLPFPCDARDCNPAIAEKSLVNDAGVSGADDVEPVVGGAVVALGAAVVGAAVLGAAVVGAVVLLLLPHAANSNPPAATAAVQIMRLVANCPPLGYVHKTGVVSRPAPGPLITVGQRTRDGR